jgi:hypothetical protein
MDDLLSLFQLAVKTRLPLRWLRQEALAGRLPCLRVGRMLRFNLSAVEELLLRRAASENVTQSYPGHSTQEHELPRPNTDQQSQHEKDTGTDP